MFEGVDSTVESEEEEESGENSGGPHCRKFGIFRRRRKGLLSRVRKKKKTLRGVCRRRVAFLLRWLEEGR